MFLKCLKVGALANNCYIFSDETKKAVIIDPGAEAEKILEVIENENLSVEMIILTHGHPDHIGALAEVKKKTGAKIVIHEKEQEIFTGFIKRITENRSGELGFSQLQPDELLKGGELLKVGDMSLEIIHTPGHSPGSICIKVDNIMFTGDTLFAGSIGRTDFPGGSYVQMMDTLNSLIKQDENIVIYPGHGVESTIKREKETNPFLR
jgi:hydroxyacylglutathione hydrolase